MKLVQRARKSDMRASMTNIQPLRSTRGEDIQTTRASSVFSPKIISGRRGGQERESLTTMTRDTVNVRQMMKVSRGDVRLRAFGLKSKPSFII